jgi:hypothetical protein
MNLDKDATSPPLETPSSVEVATTTTATGKVTPSSPSPRGSSSQTAAKGVERDSDSHEYDMSDDESSEEPPIQRGGFAELFRFATKWDLLLNGIGLLMACVAGAAQVSVI